MTNARYDVNQDGALDIDDVQAVASNWQLSIPGPCNRLTKRYYRLGGQLIAVRTNGELNYLHGDHLGSVSLLTDAAGQKVRGGEQRFHPFGTVRTGQPAFYPTERGYTGQRLDLSTDLMYYEARYYDPLLGRFVQADTIVPQPGDPQSLNRFSYVLNNPVKYQDPSGHWVESALDLAFIAYDIYDIKTHGLTWESGLSLAADVGGLLLPVVTGGGLLVRGITHADDLAAVVNHGDEVVDAVRMADRAADSSAGLRRFQTVGAEVVPDVLKSFGDEGHVVTEIPASLHNRGIRVIGRWWDTDVAEEFGERIFKPVTGTDWKALAEANYAWIHEAIQNGDLFYLASPVDELQLLPEQLHFGVAVFARELDALLQAGYRRVGDYLIPPH